jgi:hypothetical protein
MRSVLIERTLPLDDGNIPAGNSGRSGARSVTFNLAESPLGWLWARRKITEAQFIAGEALRRDFERARLGPNVTMRWDAPPMDRNRRGASSPDALTHGQLAAKERFDGAIEAAGPGLADILWRVVCAGEAVPDAERALDWPSRSGRLVLTLALDRVATYYNGGQ